MTLLDQAAARVADAVESSRKVASRLHPPGSFNLEKVQKQIEASIGGR